MKRPRILVVEDNFALADSLRDLLSDEGYAVQIALDGREGLRKARAERPDLILLDLVMPVLDGRQFRVAQRADRAIATVPTLVLTGTEVATPIDADEVYAKPFGLRPLMEAVHRFAPLLPAGA